LSEFVYCHSDVPQCSQLGPLFFIDDVVLLIFEQVSALGYADELSLFNQIASIEDCQRSQSDLEKWCLVNKFIKRRKNHELERVDEIKDLGVFLDNKMKFLTRIEPIISKWTLSRLLVRPVTLKGIERIQHNFLRFAR
jgi:hypothetical protein